MIFDCYITITTTICNNNRGVCVYAQRTAALKSLDHTGIVINEGKYKNRIFVAGGNKPKNPRYIQKFNDLPCEPYLITFLKAYDVSTDKCKRDKYGDMLCDGNVGITYGIHGVCHQRTNRINFGNYAFDKNKVKGASMSYSVYGKHGTNMESHVEKFCKIYPYCNLTDIDYKLSLKERIIKYNDGITDEQLVNVTNIINLYKKEIETLYMGNLTNIEKKVDIIFDSYNQMYLAALNKTEVVDD